MRVTQDKQFKRRIDTEKDSLEKIKRKKGVTFRDAVHQTVLYGQAAAFYGFCQTSPQISESPACGRPKRP